MDSLKPNKMFIKKINSNSLSSILKGHLRKLNTFYTDNKTCTQWTYNDYSMQNGMMSQLNDIKDVA